VIYVDVPHKNNNPDYNKIPYEPLESSIRNLIGKVISPTELENIPKIQEELEQIDYKQIRKIFLQPDMPDIGKIEFKDADYSGIVDYLANERSFSEERVKASLNRLKKSIEKRSHTLDQWFK